MSDQITLIRTPIRLEYNIQAGADLTKFLTSLTQKRIMGRRSPTGKVFVPPKGCCPVTGLPMLEEVELSDVGTVVTFAIINIPFEGQSLKPPYAVAAILLDGSDLPLFHFIGGVDVKDVRMGLRVRAVWVPDEELAPTLESIKYFEPTGEPDADFDTYKEHL